MLKIGLTGGIGSGKTIVAGIFRRLGIPVYHADDQARIIADTDLAVRDELQLLLGKEIYTANGLDREKMSSVIFSNPELLAEVNLIIHPRVRDHFFKWMASLPASRYIMQEAAILFESGASKFFDRFIAVSAPTELRIKRLLNRKGMTREKILNVMNNQMDEEEKIRRSDYVIHNDEKTPLLPQVLEIHNELIALDN